MKYLSFVAITLVSCYVPTVLEFQQEKQISLVGIDFPKDGFAVSVHSPSKNCRQLGMLELESIAGGRLVHKVGAPPLPYGVTDDRDPNYYTAKSDFHPAALRGSFWQVSDGNDVQECLDSLVGAAKTMGGNVLADFDIHRTTYQIVWREKEEHLIVREAELFLPTNNLATKVQEVQELPVVVVRGLVCDCDSI
jgi:hypothetical protein